MLSLSAEEALARAADRQHAGKVHREIAADLERLGCGNDLAREIVAAIVYGQIPRLHITY